MKRFLLMLLPVLGMVSTANATISWDHWSPLTVEETITDIGGSYRYEYSFVNVDTSPIHNFVIYPTFDVAGENKFTGHSSWFGLLEPPIDEVASVWDARNLNPNIVELVGTYTNPIVDVTTSIQISESASGFSFTTSVYDPSPKYYAYETIASGSATNNHTGNVAAVGTTVPEPMTIVLFALSGLMLRRKRNR